MKLQEGFFRCEWCGEEFQQKINRIEGQGKKGVCVDQCVCPNCNRYISQKTKFDMEMKR